VEKSSVCSDEGGGIFLQTLLFSVQVIEQHKKCTHADPLIRNPGKLHEEKPNYLQHEGER
jgi:hypothetical protein